MTPEQLKASILQYAIQGKLVEQRVVEGIHQASAGFWIFQYLPEQCLCLFFS